MNTRADYKTDVDTWLEVSVRAVNITFVSWHKISAQISAILREMKKGAEKISGTFCAIIRANT